MTFPIGMGRIRAPFLTITLFALGAGNVSTAGEACPPLAEEQTSRLTDFVTARFDSSSDLGLRLDKDEAINADCYRRLEFKGKGPLGPIHLVLFATPDLRYLTSDLLDTESDPIHESRARALAEIGLLSEGNHNSRGAENAAVTVVVFSDFQCPFCKKAARAMEEDPLLADAEKVRQVFRHLPSPHHNWAQSAAIAAACAQFQSKDAFWSLHDATFGTQEELNAINLHSKVLRMAEEIEGLDVSRFKECLTGQLSLGTVFQDRDLAKRLGVKSTPTFFVNGEEHVGFQDIHDLRDAVLRQLRRSSGGSEVPSNRGN